MFEIGSALVQARHHLGLSLAEVEHETRLRERYLRALETEQFDQLPPGYRRSFLRSYASFLGLDADLFIDEYITRHELHEPPEALSLPAPVRRPGRRLRFLALGGVAVVLAAVAAAVLVTHGRSAGKTGRTTPTAATPKTAAPQASATVATGSRPRRTIRRKATPARPKPASVRLTLTAVGGPCWLSVHKGSAQGPVAYEGTLQQGQSVSLHGSRYWARIGAPSSLSLTLDGKPQTLPHQTGNVLIDAHGVRAAP